MMSNEATSALKQAVTCLNNGKYDLAIEKCGEAIRRHGADAAAFYLRAVAHRANGDYARASADVGEARRLAPAGAIAGFKEALGWQLGNAIGFYNRGSAYHNERDHDRAINNYTEAIRLDRAYAAACLGRAVAFETRDRNNPRSKRYDERYPAEPDCDRAMRDYRMVLALDANAAARRIAKAGLDRLLAQEAGALKLK
jgi:tetratricopeptide (TPR) repeat protein